MTNDFVDMVCIGEGEEAIVELVKNMSSKEEIINTPNLFVKEGKRIVRPQIERLVDVDTLPIPKYNIFSPERIYRPMDGNFYRMLPIEISRGCPYQYTYCSAPFYNNKFKHVGKWLRFKSIENIIREIDYYAKNYNATYFYFISETFLAMSKRHRQEFYERYKIYKIPFWFNTRPETIKEEEMKQLEDIGCHRISIGIESGNEQFRRKVLKRNYSNETLLKAINFVLKTKIQLSVNNMIGFPDETREMIFDTIELNRQFKADSHSISIYQPFKGTVLYNECVSKKYFDPSKICSESFATPVLNMPTLRKEEIKGLYRTFNLYVHLDKIYWPEIKIAEGFDERGNKTFGNLVSKMNR